MKHALRFVAVVTTIIMLLLITAGCKDSTNKNSGQGSDGHGDTQAGTVFDSSEYIYKLSQSITIPGELIDVRGLVFTDGKLFFSAYTYQKGNYESAYTYPYSYLYTACIYSVNTDGTGLAPLPEHKTPAEAPGDASGGSRISAMRTDSDGNLWVTEEWVYFSYDLPDAFDPQHDERYFYFNALSSGNMLRKLDSAGNELLRVDLDSLMGISDHREYLVHAFETDASGNIYIAADDWWDAGGMAVYVIDNSGNLMFKINTDDWFDGFTAMANGSIAVVFYDGLLQPIDVEVQDFADAADISDIDGRVLSGSGGFDILISNYEGFYGFAVGDAEATKLIDWFDSNVTNRGIDNISILPDGRIICINLTANNMSGSSVYELLVLGIVPVSEISTSQKTELTIAGIYISGNSEIT